MATSGKSSKLSKATSTGAEKGNEKKAASTAPVLLSNPISPEGPVISRIPPSIPIESTMLGQSETPIPAAIPRSAATDAASAMAGRVPVAPEKPAEKPAPAAAATPAPATAAVPTGKPAPQKAPAPRKGGFWSLALGGAVAAGAGAAAAIWAMPHLAPVTGGADPAAIRTEAVAAATQAGASAGSDAAAKAIAALPPAQGGGAEMQAQLAAQAEKIAALEAALAARPAASGDASTAGLSGADSAEINTLRAAVAAQAQQIEALTARPQLDPQALAQVQALALSADQVKADIEAAAASARQSLDAVQTEAEAATQRAQVVASVAALGAALEHGDSADEAVQQLENAGVEVPAPLAQEDLPTLVQIQMGFDAVARAALKDSLKAESRDGGAMTAMGNFLRVQTGARSVEPREGDDPDAVLSRAGALVDQGEITTALAELAALPPEGQQAMADWMAQAQAYLDAEAALHDVATTTLN